MGWRDRLSPLEADVVAAVQRHEYSDGRFIGADPRDVCADLPEDDEDVVVAILQRLYSSGVLERDLTGRYALPEF